MVPALIAVVAIFVLMAWFLTRPLDTTSHGDLDLGMAINAAIILFRFVIVLIAGLVATLVWALWFK